MSDFWSKYPSATIDPMTQPEGLMSTQEGMVEERGLLGDVVHDVFVGTNEALNVLGYALDSEGLIQSTENMKEMDLYKPDVSQYMGTQGRAKRVMDGVLQSLPTTLGITGATMAGSALGPAAGAGAFTGAMGLYGTGVYRRSLAEIEEEHPEMSQQDKEKYALTIALAEGVPEAVTALIPAGVGAVLKAGAKPSIKTLVASGRMTPGEALDHVVRKVGVKKAVGTLFGSAALDGGSEVLTEAIQQDADREYGMPYGDVDYLDVFLIGSAPGGILSGATLAKDARARSKARAKLEEGLQSQDLNERLDTVDILREGLSATSPELGDHFFNLIEPKVQEGPVSLETVLKEQKPLVAPEEVLQEAGIPVRTTDPIATAEATDRIDLEAMPEIYEETRVYDEGIYEDTIPDLKGTVDTFMSVADPEIFKSTRKEWVKDKKEGMKEVEVETTIDQMAVPLYDAAILDDARAQAIKQGMSKVIEDTNKLEETTDLDEREALQKSIEKKQRQIKKELDSAKALKVQQVEPKVQPKVEPEVQPVQLKETQNVEAVVPEESGSSQGVVQEEGPRVERPSGPVESTTYEEAVGEEKLDEAGMERAIKLMDQGATPDDAFILAQRGVTSLETPIEIEKGRWSDGTEVRKGTGRAKAYKIIGTDGIERRARNQKEVQEAIQSGSVSSLPLYEGAERTKTVEKIEGQADQASVLSFLEENPLTSFPLDLRGYVGEAIAQLSSRGTELTKKSVRDYAKKLQKSEVNKEEGQQLQKAGLRSDVKSTEELYESELSSIETMDDVEVEDTLDLEEDRSADYARAATPVQKGKGRDTLKRLTYYKDGDTWKKISAAKAKELPKGTPVEVREQTPDGAFTLGTRTEKVDGVTRISVDVYDTEGNKLNEEPLADKWEAEEFIKNERSEELSLVSGPEELAMNFYETSPNTSIAIARLKDANVYKFKEEALAILEKKRGEELKINAKYPDGLSLLESIMRSPLKSQKLTRDLAKMLYENVDHKKLKDIQVVVGKRNSHKNGRITLTKFAEPSTKLHELIHGITVRELIANPEIQKEVESLRKKAIKAAVDGAWITPVEKKALYNMETYEDFVNARDFFANPNVAYGLFNDMEFLAQAFGSPQFQEFLKSVPSGNRNLWQSFISLVQKILGIEGTMLEDVIAIVPVIAQKKQKATELESFKDPVAGDAFVRQVLNEEQKYAKIYERGKDIRKFAEDLLRPVADRIQALSPKIHGLLMKFETNLMLKQKEYSSRSKRFLKYYKDLSKSQQIRLDQALMNSQLKENQEIIKEVPKDIYEDLQWVLNDLNERAKAVGLNGPSRAFYFPRRVQDLQGLIAHYGANSTLEYAFQKEAARRGIKELSEEDKAQITTDMFQAGYLRQLPRPGASKERSIPFVEPETFKFYAKAPDALMAHIYEMNEKVGQREFIGGSTRKKRIKELERKFKEIEGMKEGPERDAKIQEYQVEADRLENLEADLQEGLAAMVYKEAPDNHSEIIDLLNARLRQKGAYGVVDTFRNISYITTMGNFLSAITQLGDIPIIFYAHGFNPDSVKAAGTAFKRIAKIIKNEMQGKRGESEAFVDYADFTNQLREFTADSKSSKLVERFFKWSGLKYTDLIGKEAFMEAGYRKWRKASYKDFQEKFGEMFGKDTEKVFQDIKAGRKNANVLSALIAELGDFQPVSLSQQPKGYLLAGNMRIFYMLKTFTIRTTSAALREGANSFKEGKYAEGAIRIASVLMLYAMAGAGADELKDMIRGREVALDDQVYDNLLQMFFLSRFSLDKGFQQENVFDTVLGDMMFPVRYADNLAADLYALVEDEKEFKAKSINTIPIVGPAVYSRTQAGQDSIKKQRREALLKEVRENKKRKKGAYSGNISKKVREYNKSVSRDMKITNDNIMRAYKDA